jgi:hypothetical protein
MSRDWVYDRALARELPSYKLPGGKRRFLYSELLDALKRFKEAPERAVQRLDAVTSGAGVGEAWGGA